jgi:hypothetical protein
MYITINNTLFVTPEWTQKNLPWQHVIDEYKQQGGDVRHVLVHANRALVAGAHTVRAGRDIYFDGAWMNISKENPQQFISTLQTYSESLQDKLQNLFPENRIHILNNGGHVDGCFALLKPGVILASNYFDCYEKTFPGWNRIETAAPEFSSHSKHSPLFNNGKWWRNNGKWWVPGMAENKAFNNHIVRHAQTWIGNYTETFFEVNCLVIDEKNVIVLGEHESIFRRLEEYGITAHSIPFRTRTFWDGGMHCLTLDIRRQTKLEDLFPERGDGPGMILVDDPSTFNPLMAQATQQLQDELKKS